MLFSFERGKEDVFSRLKESLGGGFKDFSFSPLFGEDSHFD